VKHLAIYTSTYSKMTKETQNIRVGDILELTETKDISADALEFIVKKGDIYLATGIEDVSKELEAPPRTYIDICLKEIFPIKEYPAHVRLPSPFPTYPHSMWKKISKPEFISKCIASGRDEGTCNTLLELKK